MKLNAPKKTKPAPKPEKPQPDIIQALEDVKAIPLVAQVAQVKTNLDGGWSITLEGSGQLESVMMFLSVAKRPGVIVESVNIFIDQSREKKPEKQDESENAKGIY